MTLAELILNRRTELNWSRWRLGQITGLGITQIKKIEEGGPCWFTTAVRLFRALDIDNIKTRNIEVSR